MRIVPIHCITPGTLLAKSLYSDNGTILLKKGVELTVALLERIKDNGIYSVFIDDGYSMEIIEDIIKPEVKQKAIKAIRETFDQIERQGTRIDESSPFQKKMQKIRMTKYIQSLRSICEYIVEDITKSNVVMINLVDIKNIGTYHYQHALNVALLSLILGIEQKYTKHELYNLFIGAILHDIGKAFIPPELLEMKPPYEDAVLQVLKGHPLAGYQYIKEHFPLEAPASIPILQHHERYDGKGYPKNLYGEYIHRNARIIAICNLYDDLTSDTPTHRAFTAHEVIELIMGNSGAAFDPKLVELFVRKVQPYPVGSLVLLSNGDLAAVRADSPDFPLRPVVELVDLETKQCSGVRIDLMTHNDIVIQKIVTELEAFNTEDQNDLMSYFADVL